MSHNSATSSAAAVESEGEFDRLSDAQAYLWVEAYEKALADLQKAAERKTDLDAFIFLHKKVISSFLPYTVMYGASIAVMCSIYILFMFCFSVILFSSVQSGAR